MAAFLTGALGLNVTSNYNESRQTFEAETSQILNTSCNAICGAIQENVVIDVSGGRNINITLQQACSANASCMITNVASSLAELALQNEQEAIASGKLPFVGANISVNSNISKQEISNIFEQEIKSRCNVQVDFLQQDINIIAKDVNNGNIVLNQSGNATADCIMDIAAKVRGKYTARVKQTAVSSFGFSIFFILAIVGIILAFIFYFAWRRASKSANKAEEAAARTQTKITPLD